jgi:hypothetical protein
MGKGILGVVAGLAVWMGVDDGRQRGTVLRVARSFASRSSPSTSCSGTHFLPGIT